MRLLITASRTWDDAPFIYRVLDGELAGGKLVILYHGACPTGGDAIADAWAIDRQAQGERVIVERFPANWGSYGRAAGMRRNAEMVAALGDGGPRACFAFIREKSKGASHCAKLARRAGVPVTVFDWADREQAVSS